MDVHLFKEIYWLEYLHRLLGRVIGIVFLLPFVAFVALGYIRKHEWPRYALMFVLGGLQGLLGWYMVKSGLVDRPEVSQYRLTAHLVAALIIYAFMLWVALSLLYPRRTPDRHPWFGRSVALLGLVSLTIVSGGFVAGLKAGKIFNTFPMMGDYWIPPGVLALSPGWRNLFDNPALVQFDHRLLAVVTFCIGIAYVIGLRRIPRSARTAVAQNLLLIALVAQVLLGIGTLLLHVPIALAASHQAVAVILFTSVLAVVHSMRDSLSGEPALQENKTSIGEPGVNR
jgi:cytochrome c oxidase assembly protein subunit 15